MFDSFVAVASPSGYPIIGKLVRSHPENPRYVYIEDKWGRLDGGILLPTFHGPFLEEKS